MSQNDDELNMQTFQIYQDDPIQNKKEEIVETKGKNKQKAEKTRFIWGGSELVKGSLIGFGIVVVVIILDMFAF